ncbi:MAG: bifunctional DNA primase/polymerase [Bryobacterales bacterium]|nr:bifunctional DNA primase/polymerase [Bryobacterales bacterium]
MSAAVPHPAEQLIDAGFHPIPVPDRSKNPGFDGWQNLRLRRDDIPKYFNGRPQNIGVLVGDEYGTTDVDLDWHEAVRAADFFLPDTGMIFGRKSKPRSHWFYRMDPPLPSRQYRDIKDAEGKRPMIVELRCQKQDGSAGLQTIVPPSRHDKTGEDIEFAPGCGLMPANIDADELLPAVARTAAAALLARHWPARGSGRHNTMLALAGGLARAGWNQEEARLFCKAIYHSLADPDRTAMNRSDGEVESTYKRKESGEDFTGWPHVIEAVGGEVVDLLAEWLGFEKPSRSVNHGPYQERDSGIIRVKAGKDGSSEEVVLLTNFTARITSNVGEDDGVEIRRSFAIEGKLYRQEYSVIVPANRFSSMDWAIECIGPRAIVYPNQREWARTAIQTLSSDIRECRIYTHTGWRTIEGRDLYLHGGGAIGKGGCVQDVDVRLSGALANYNLTLPDSNQALINAIRASLRLLDVASDRISHSLLGATYRACIRACDFSVWLVGPTGVFKSELAALAQQHYGATMNARHLPGNFASTGNALEMLAFAAKDAVVVVDDFAPHGSAQDVNRYHSTADRLLRAVGNNQGRGRLSSDARLREQKPPRGLVVATGEDLPRGQSIRGRTFIVEVAPGDVRTDILTECQRSAASGMFTRAMGGFIRWLASSYETTQSDFQKCVEDARTQATKAHARTPGIVADLCAGFEFFLVFAVEVGAITTEQRETYSSRCWQAMNEVARAQRIQQTSSEPAARFIELLRAAILSGEAHIATTYGNPPDDPEVWGWSVVGSGDKQRSIPKGRCIGWVDGADLYLEPVASYAVAQELGRKTGEPLVVGETTLRKRMREKGLLKSVDESREVLTVRKTIQRQQASVLHVSTAIVGFSGSDVGS